MRQITAARKPLAKFPMTEKLYPVVSKQRGKVQARPQYVSEGLLGTSQVLAPMRHGYRYANAL